MCLISRELHRCGSRRCFCYTELAVSRRFEKGKRNRNDPMTQYAYKYIRIVRIYIYINSINHTIFFFIIFVLRLERDERGVRIDNNFIFYFDF